MKFALIDQITELDPGSRIVATKAVSLAEEYLGGPLPDVPSVARRVYAGGDGGERIVDGASARGFRP